MIIKKLSAKKKRRIDILTFAYYYLLRPFFAIVFSFYKVELIGRENLPYDRGFILAANHSNFLDAPFIAWSLRPRPIYWIVSKDIYNKWYFRPICVIARSIPVNGSVKAAQDVLEKGSVIGIFPQGGICCDRLVRKGRKGVAVLAKKTGAPIVPCYIKATLSSRKRVNITPKAFTPLTLICGKPLYFEKSSSEIIPQDILEDMVPKITGAINKLAYVDG